MRMVIPGFRLIYNVFIIRGEILWAYIYIHICKYIQKTKNVEILASLDYVQ